MCFDLLSNFPGHRGLSGMCHGSRSRRNSGAASSRRGPPNFGSRRKPSDPEEVADVMPVETSKPRRKKTASEALTYQELGPKMVCQTDTTFTPQALQTVTAVDWNSGETPIDAWPNQS